MMVSLISNNKRVTLLRRQTDRTSYGKSILLRAKNP